MAVVLSGMARAPPRHGTRRRTGNADGATPLVRAAHGHGVLVAARPPWYPSVVGFIRAGARAREPGA